MLKKHLKKVLSALLVAAMFVTAAPVASAYAFHIIDEDDDIATKSYYIALNDLAYKLQEAEYAIPDGNIYTYESQNALWIEMQKGEEMWSSGTATIQEIYEQIEAIQQAIDNLEVSSNPYPWMTTDPSVTDPASTDPASTDPVSTEPVSTEPVSTEPVSTEPASTQPASETQPTTAARGGLAETQEFYNALKAYLDKVGGEYYYLQNYTPENIRSYDVLSFFEETDSRVIFGIRGVMDALSSQELNGCEFHANNLFSDADNPCGYCVYSDGVLYTIAEAVEKGIAQVSELAAVIPGTKNINETTAPSSTATVPSETATQPASETQPTTAARGGLAETQEFYNALKAYLDRVGGEYYYLQNYTPENIRSYDVLSFFEETDSRVIFGIRGVMDALSSQELNGCEFHANNLFSDADNPCGYCVYSDGVLYTIAEAVEKGIAQVSELAAVIPGTKKITDATAPTVTEPTESVQPTQPAKPKPVVKKTKKANPMTVSVKTKTIKAKKLKKAKQTVKAITVSKAKGKVSYAKIKSGTTKKIFKKVTIGKNGKITLKKGKYKKGTYRVKIKITAKGNSSYRSKTKTVTVKLKVKS